MSYEVYPGFEDIRYIERRIISLSPANGILIEEDEPLLLPLSSDNEPLLLVKGLLSSNIY